MATPVQLVFTGELLEGFERGEVARQLGQWLGLDDTKAAKLFTGARIVLKRSIEPEDAQRYVTRFAQAGARLHIEPIAASAAQPAGDAAARPPQPRPQADAGAAGARAQGMAGAPGVSNAANAPNPAIAALAPVATAAPGTSVGDAEIVCPNCGERQPKRELCRACATNMPMGIAAKIEAEQAAREARKAAFDARRGVRPAAAAGSAATGDVVPIWGFGFEGRMGRLTYATAGAMAMSPLFLLLTFALKKPSASRFALFGLAALVVGVLSVRWSILRLHDLDRSGWWSLTMGVPSLNAGVGLILSLWPGTKDDNDYGEVPAEGSWRLFGGSVLAAVICAGFSFSAGWSYMQAADSDKTEPMSSEEGPGPGSADASPPLIRFPQAESDAVLAARAAFSGEYAQARGHKAFALSSSGAWGMKSGAASPEEAMVGALASCDAQRAPESSPCKTINLNGQGSRSP